jgi:hypothetical protein
VQQHAAVLGQLDFAGAGHEPEQKINNIINEYSERLWKTNNLWRHTHRRKIEKEN